MAKKTKPEEVKTEDVKAEEVKAEAVKVEETQTEQPETPIEGEMQGFVANAVFVQLKTIHPHSSYGRVGYRFNKAESIRIALEDLTDGQLDMLTEDPWLDVIFSAE